MMIENLNRRVSEQPAFHRREGKRIGITSTAIALAAMLLLLTTFVVAESPDTVIWDDFNAHIWTVSLEKPADMQHMQQGWFQDNSRSVFHIDYEPDATTSRYLLAFTNLLAPETLDGVSELRFDLKWD